MKNNIYIDTRWKNAGGIGTFFEGVNNINQYTPLPFSGSPASPIDTFRMAFQLRNIKKGVVFLPGYISPFKTRLPYAVTVHDLNHLERPENSSPLKIAYYNTFLKRGCLHAEYVFTVSEFSRKRIIEWAGIEPSKVVNVGNGVSPKFQPEGERINLGYEYILCVSNRKGHKNEFGTLEAFKHADIDESIKLVFTGKANSEILEKINLLKLSNRVVFTGFIPETELPKLYRSAKALIFVSFYEGFGLPVIEAMASGVPVVTSNTSSLGEISGDAALLANPNDTMDISKKLTQVINDFNVAKSLMAKGLVHSKKYTWHKTAKLIDDYLNKIHI
ncbi:glycosyltransferase family 4 protein [Klebsiella pneumoniae]|uniref:glycosyltransferase family 4 protein n=1 Tax=Klebsiella pneumoniae TaxID=573 RepID=UPI000DE6D532|nr:glycosyltransferase family 1 protein [Klebsiella pneumoniae]SSK98838.1 Partial mannosyltransferase B [Klebsiella pneumoniae]